jgi:hypothetical protein
MEAHQAWNHKKYKKLKEKIKAAEQLVRKQYQPADHRTSHQPAEAAHPSLKVAQS